MHDPELLILDEPTVGVDPLLRQSIWNHLVHITKAGQKTVIITTHYIEEARQAHTVSIRDGTALPTPIPNKRTSSLDRSDAIGSPAGGGISSLPAVDVPLQ